MKRIYCSLSLSLIVFFASFRKFLEADTFWHLKIGELALSNPDALKTDPFSFSYFGVPWPYKDLIADIVLFFGLSHFGFAWFILLKALAAVSIGVALWYSQKNLARNFYAFILTFALLIAALSPRFLDRPLLFTLALFPWVISILGQIWNRSDRGFKYYFFLLGVQWLWALFHREALIGLVLSLAFLTFDAIRRPKSISKALFFAPLLILVTALTPNGFSIFSTSFSAVKSGSLVQFVMEWKPPVLSELFEGNQGFLLLMALLIVCLALSLKRMGLRPRWGSFDSFLGFVWGILFCLFLGSIRWCAPLSIVSAFILLPSLTDWFSEKRILKVRGIQPLIFLISVSAVFKFSPYPLGMGPEESVFPGDALRVAKKLNLHSSVMNFYDFGGYIIGNAWPRFKVFVDGRADTVYPLDFVQEAVKSAGYKDSFEKFSSSADWVLASNQAKKESHMFLSQDPSWALLFWSESASIYVKRAAYPELAPRFLKYLPLFFSKTSRVSEIFSEVEKAPQGLFQLKAELEAMLKEADSDIRLHLWLALLESRLGLRTESEQRMRDISKRFSGHPLWKDLQEMK